MGIGGQHSRTRMQFSHSNKASVGKIHWETSIRTLQRHQPLDFVFRVECEIDDSEPHPIKDRKRIAAAFVQKKLRLGQHRFAGEYRRRQPAKYFSRPRVMLVVRIQRRDQRPGVSENSFGLDWHWR